MRQCSKNNKSVRFFKSNLLFKGWNLIFVQDQRSGTISEKKKKHLITGYIYTWEKQDTFCICNLGTDGEFYGTLMRELSNDDAVSLGSIYLRHETDDDNNWSGEMVPVS